MAIKKGVRIQIVVEDEVLERFVRETLLLFGFARHELRVTPYPVGQGSAKDWVDRQYPIEVKALRAKAYQQLGIVVGTDPDELTVTQRGNRLAAALLNAKATARTATERIVHWISKWNVETWILYFAGDARDEDNDYKNAVRKPDYVATAAGFVDEYRKIKANNVITTQPSLNPAYEETKRLGV